MNISEGKERKSMQIKKPRGSMTWYCMIHIARSFVNSRTQRWNCGGGEKRQLG
ncbi:hypothetical protein Peur_040820 [Populus x canadensis]